jgi:O-antigen/teichoic acid export membrane protein
MRLVKKRFQSYVNPTDRGQRRVIRSGITGITTVVVKGISSIAGLISIPLTAQYLGTERFGLWLILSTLLSWISIADLGLANSLTNALATADGKEDRKGAREAVSSAFWLIIAVALILVVLFSIIYPLVPWERVFNVTSAQAKEDVGSAVIVCFTFFVLRLPLSIPGRIYGAYQEGYFYQMWSGLSSLTSVIGLIVAIQLQVSLPLLIVAFFGTLLLGDIFSAIHLFYFRRKWLLPNFANFSWLKSKWLFKTGIQFWIVQVCAIVLSQTDLIIVAQLFSASAVASYGVILKLFTFTGFMQSAFLNPLWSAYSEALSKSDWHWIIKIFKKSVYISSMFSLISGVLLVIVIPQIVSSWVNQVQKPEMSLLLAMLFTSILSSVAQCVAMLVNGLGEIRLQTFVAPISAITNLFLSLILGNLIGVSGVAWSTGICILIFSLGIVGNDIFRKMKSIEKSSEYF